jgi:hypothetical protein
VIAVQGACRDGPAKFLYSANAQALLNLYQSFLADRKIPAESTWGGDGNLVGSVMAKKTMFDRRAYRRALRPRASFAGDASAVIARHENSGEDEDSQPRPNHPVRHDKDQLAPYRGLPGPCDRSALSLVRVSCFME